MADAVLVQMLENANEYILHGYAYADWLRDIPNPQVHSHHLLCQTLVSGSRPTVSGHFLAWFLWFAKPSLCHSVKDESCCSDC